MKAMNENPSGVMKYTLGYNVTRIFETEEKKPKKAEVSDDDEMMREELGDDVEVADVDMPNEISDKEL